MKGTNRVKTLTNRRTAAVSLGLLILTSGPSTVWAQATRTPLEGMTALYTFAAGPFTGYILDPHGE